MYVCCTCPVFLQGLSEVHQAQRHLRASLGSERGPSRRASAPDATANKPFGRLSFRSGTAAVQPTDLLLSLGSSFEFEGKKARKARAMVHAIFQARSATSGAASPPPPCTLITQEAW